MIKLNQNFFWIIMAILYTSTLFLAFNVNKLHPMFIIISIMMITILSMMNLSSWKSNFLISMIIMLIIITGLMIIFIYFSSMIANMKNNIPWFNMLTNLMILITMSYSLIKVKKKYLINFNLMEISSTNKMLNPSFNKIEFMYLMPTSNLTIMSIMFILFTLMIIVKMCSINNKSLRKIK